MIVYNMRFCLTRSSMICRTPKATQLGQSKITVTSIAPREVVTYAKETQTHVIKEETESEGGGKFVCRRGCLRALG